MGYCRIAILALTLALGGAACSSHNGSADRPSPTFDPTDLSQLKALAESQGFTCRGSDANPGEPSQLDSGGEGWACTDAAQTMLLFLEAGEGVDGRASLEAEGCPGRGYYWGGKGFEVDLLFQSGASGEAAQAFGAELSNENLVCSQL